MANLSDSQTVLDEGAGYFLYHSIGMFRGKQQLIEQGLSEYASLWSTPNDSQWPQALSIRQRFIDRWRALINADAGTLTTADNVTTALYSVIGSLPAAMLRGRRVLVAADCFPSLHFLLAGMAQRCGFTLDTVPLRSGEAWVRDEDFLSRWKGDVAVALLTQCTSTASYRSDIASMVAHARSVGSLVGVDITQGVGLLPFDVRASDVDFTVSTSLKWLSGTSGAGILHVRGSLLSQCSPELRGWFSQANPFSWALDAFAYAADARRFDHGTPSIVACAGTLPVLDWHAQQNQSERLAHNRRLSSKIIAAADAAGLPLVSPREEGRRGGSVMIRLPTSADTRAIIAHLRETGVYADCRGSTLRLSPGDLTMDAGVDQLFTHLKQLL
jgi:selenocysteine lyase/cysteine desulfurase